MVARPLMGLMWEAIGGNESSPVGYRLRVPGGWLYCDVNQHQGPDQLVFIADHAHVWDELHAADMKLAAEKEAAQ